MITVFTRRELLITMDMSRSANVRSLLAANGIEYSIKVTNLRSTSAIGSSRARNGSFGIDQNRSYEYKIYVHKNDYEKALRLIG